MSIYATSRPDPSPFDSIRPCARCGYEREARPNAVLCADCTSVLTTAERSLWLRVAA